MLRLDCLARCFYWISLGGARLLRGSTPGRRSCSQSSSTPGARGQLANGFQCQDGVLGSLEPEISDRAFSSAPFATSSGRVPILNHVAALPTVVLAPRPLPTGASAVAAMTLRASSAIRQLVRMRMGVLPKAGQHPLQTRPGEQGSPAHARQIDRARELRLCSAARHARNCRRCAGFERQPSSATGTHR
jgi:hypothetical protein